MPLSPVTGAFLAQLEEAAPDALRDLSPGYLEEPRGKFRGQAGALVAPASTDQVSAILRLAHEARVPVIPYGGGTGLVSGQIAPELPLPLILSLERMRAIRSVHGPESVLVAEAGATVADVQIAAEEAGLLFPLSYAADGTARIGGALAVNSGGLNVLRYGAARDLCLGLEAVLADGRVFHGLKRLRKDNTGYDLRNLLIGSEGTLGVITAAALRLYPRPAQQTAAYLAVASPEAALSILARAGRLAGETVSAFELISGVAFGFLSDTGLGPRQPFETPPEWMVLMELGTSEGADGAAALEAIFAEALEAGEATDGVIAQSAAQRDAFWALREAVPEANRLIGAVASHDISLPLSELPGFLERAGAALTGLNPRLRVNAFGHLGDGNLHYNIFPPDGQSRADWAHLADDVTRIVHDLCMGCEGSFSAEHGVGRMKVAELERYGDPVKLAVMGQIKTTLDPNGILNPGAVLRAR